MTTDSNTNTVEIRAENLEPPSWMDGFHVFTLAVLRELSVRNWEVSILLTDDAQMRRLNHTYRGLDGPTDVLSFAALDGGENNTDERISLTAPTPVGDIVIDLPYVERQAATWEVPSEQELRRVTIHGLLHLAGYDHHTNNIQEEPMLRLQESILETVKERIY